MDDGFIRNRLVTVRHLAERADPFTRRRLLDLATRYERQISKFGVTGRSENSADGIDPATDLP
jgi:hypothetical protein